MADHGLRLLLVLALLLAVSAIPRPALAARADSIASIFTAQASDEDPPDGDEPADAPDDDGDDPDDAGDLPDTPLPDQDLPSDELPDRELPDRDLPSGGDL